MTQDFKCVNIGEWGHLRNDYRKKRNIKRGPMPYGICQRCGRGQHLIREYRATTDKWANLLPKNSRGASCRPQCQAGRVPFLDRGSQAKTKNIINNIETEGMVDTGADVKIISPKSWSVSKHTISRSWGLIPNKAKY